MGKKIDYRPESKKKLSKKLKIAGIIILAIIILYILVQSIIRAYRITFPKETSLADRHSNVDDYESVQDILTAHGCTYISETKTSELTKYYVRFNKDLYDGTTSNERFFDNLIKVIADFTNYQSFELIDEQRDIDILVTCEGSAIVQIKINDDENYYLNHDSEINKSKSKTEITEFSIDSNQLQKLIDNNWNPTGIIDGNQDSTCGDYKIYFDEGFRYSLAGRTIYNLIFTEKYTGRNYFRIKR